MSLVDAFDAHLSGWKEWQATPWGRLRYRVAQANVQRHLPTGPLRILDVAGGNGLDTIPLAAAGHHITLVDFSEEMLAEARRNAEASSVAGRMTLHHADFREVPALFPQPAFDVVLCHNLLQYVDDAAEMLRMVSHPLKPGGLISVMASNRYSSAYRTALQQFDFAAAASQLGATSSAAQIFDVSVRMYAGEEIIPLLEEAGCTTLLGHYGVRCVNDYIANNEIKADPSFFAELEQLELAMSDKYPYYLLARFFQLLARKQVD
ncbi:MAG TPA: methyltransferase domain-containing protein [Ktedonobacterales bacterium]|nr:methyltransferase domain-containing protein [Ktedonobacterales bacterium]